MIELFKWVLNRLNDSAKKLYPGVDFTDARLLTADLSWSSWDCMACSNSSSNESALIACGPWPGALFASAFAIFSSVNGICLEGPFFGRANNAADAELSKEYEAELAIWQGTIVEIQMNALYVNNSMPPTICRQLFMNTLQR